MKKSQHKTDWCGSRTLHTFVSDSRAHSSFRDRVTWLRSPLMSWVTDSDRVVDVVRHVWPNMRCPSRQACIAGVIASIVSHCASLPSNPTSNATELLRHNVVSSFRSVQMHDHHSQKVRDGCRVVPSCSCGVHLEKIKHTALETVMP